MSDKKEVTTREERLPERNREFTVIVPLVDIYENENEILLNAEMPGVMKEDIGVHIDNGKLEISGTRNVETIGAASWEEFGNVEYRRVFSVPQTIDVEKVNAELKDGVLRLHLTKAESAKPREIEIRVA